MKMVNVVLKSLVLLGLMTACGQTSEDSQLHSGIQSCSSLNLKAEPTLVEQGLSKKISLEVAKNGYQFSCTTAVVDANSHAIIAFGMQDIFHRSADSVKIDFLLPLNQSPQLNQVKIALLNGLNIGKVLWGDSNKAPASQPAPGQAAGGSSQVACSFNINGKLYEGKSQAECDKLKKDLGLDSALPAPSIPTAPAAPSAGGTPSTQVACAFNINGTLYEGKSQAECDKLRKDLGLGVGF
jgi:hypothetical protein